MSLQTAAPATVFAWRAPKDLGPNPRLVLLAVALLADEALYTSLGYRSSSTKAIALRSGFAESTTSRILAGLAHAGLVAKAKPRGYWRIAEQAFA